jgi:uncharacterized membrane protein YheB (UPF0754 family)
MEPENPFQLMLLLIALPLIGAGIGWLTNRVAIQMLFRPRRPCRFLGMTFQGLIPRRQGEMARKVGEIVERDLFNQHLIKEQIQAIELQPYLEGLARTLVRERLAPKLKQIPLVGNLINERALASFEQMAMESLEGETGPLLDKVATEVEQRIAVRKIVEDRIHAFEMDQLERLVRDLAREEFRRIELLGALLGFIIGCIQVLLLWGPQLLLQ